MTLASDTRQGNPTLVLMHFFGSSHHEWAPVLPLLSADIRVVTLDMPGFGRASDVTGYDVAAMTRHVRDAIESAELENVILVGHSFSGRMAMTVAAERPDWLRALVLVAPSPPGPQPISNEEHRFQLDFDFSEAQARQFIDGASAVTLAPHLYQQAVEDAINANPAAWRAWPSETYAEDWADRVGTLDLPAWVLVGDKDPSLPPSTQRELVMPHLEHGELEVFPGYGHLLPMEMPETLAERLQAIAARFA
ncbi:alpha/beta fold hydrolase [Salinicola rhizosphaerae]|uniref:Hydrolase n=1 Tax=Salinicola rhizosphaerae TaxID=1443141 RepID=A0ABQ3ECD2_9GAMM|nr:alpha/beta hydrolase [Salinicola rhizosphaerae]GHB31911.1 hydrolase [Salinicola rhizosphaerae]